MKRSNAIPPIKNTWPRPSKKIKTSAAERVREDLRILPEAPTVDDFKERPVEGFGAAYFAGYGWYPGMEIGRKRKQAEDVVNATDEGMEIGRKRKHAEDVVNATDEGMEIGRKRKHAEDVVNATDDAITPPSKKINSKKIKREDLHTWPLPSKKIKRLREDFRSLPATLDDFKERPVDEFGLARYCWYPGMENEEQHVRLGFFWIRPSEAVSVPKHQNDGIALICGTAIYAWNRSCQLSIFWLSHKIGCSLLSLYVTHLLAESFTNFNNGTEKEKCNKS